MTEQIAETFNDCFVNVSKNLAEKIDRIMHFV